MKVRVSLLVLLVAGSVSSAALAADPPAPKPDTAKVETKIDDPMLEPIAAPTQSISGLAEARTRILARSTDSRIAAAEVKRAEAAWRGALAQALPNIGLEGNVTQLLIPSSTYAQLPGSNQLVSIPAKPVFTAGASLSLPLIDVKSWYDIGTANRSSESAQYSYEDVKRTMMLSIASAMVAVYTAERVAEIGRIGLRNSLERLELTKQRVTLGAGNKLDVLRVETDVATARSSVVTNNEALRQTREALGVALGYNSAMGVNPDLRLESLEEDASKACKPLPSLDKRTDFLASQKRIEAAERKTTSAKYSFLPTLTGRSGAGMSSREGDIFVWNISAVLSFTLWDGGARYAEMRTAAAGVEAEVQKLEALNRKATIEVTQAKRAVTVAEDSRRVAQQAREAAFETDRLTRTSYTEGRGTSLELVSAATALRQADVNLALREFELVRARLLATLTLSRCDL